MKNFIFSIPSVLLLTYISATCAASITSNSTPQDRASNDACADPDVALVFATAYSTSRQAHGLRTPITFVQLDSTPAGDDWHIQQEAFLAWDTPQSSTSTFPLHQLYNSDTKDYIYVVSTDGNTPVAAGYVAQDIAGYVYSTPECDSVPLYSASQQAVGDHFYTTSEHDHKYLLANGWVDAGVTAHVLPLS